MEAAMRELIIAAIISCIAAYFGSRLPTPVDWIVFGIVALYWVGKLLGFNLL